MANLVHLPVEILLRIQKHFTKSTLNYFSQVCRHFYFIFNYTLYNKNTAGALWQAKETGNADTLRKLLGYCPRTKEPDLQYTIWSPLGHTPMSAAVYSGSAEVVQTLIDSGFNSSDKDRNGYTPLSWAALYGHTDIIAILLKTSIDPDRKDMYGRTPLNPECQDDDYYIVEARARQEGLYLVPLFLMNHGRLYKQPIPRKSIEWAERNNCTAVQFFIFNIR
ncbi:ankyrin repeat-containing domain protein [Aspergillus caelatus]|uniref:Ankyrin repeat-containing domain protein n=1 Tax=Aspergillus caelatus TaxID=61420 RepID=A0A5N6ZNG2_9EURO|nr:ankyrin repeat-containing domain protein [Aspergillus caelatus]KAE8358506.1 ankyrin repeat-containing domain protein [Aspergillus caelatus]